MTTFYRLLLLTCLATPLWSQQDFKIAAAGKTIEFREIDQLTIVGVAGSELSVGGTPADKERDALAAGLRKISATGLKDNTGHGLSITESDGRLLVQQVGGEGNAITVRVPNSATVKVEQSTYRGDDLTVKDFTGELDVSMMYNAVNLENVTGPAAVNAVYGDVTARWSTAPTQDVRLHSTYSNVDVSLPATTKANLRLSTGYGSMFTDFDIQLKANTVAAAASRREEPDFDRPDQAPNDLLSGTINGGGPLLSLTATYSNLYLRKK